ncbi:MAG: mechanosensitive ion channel family protein, partial [Bacteroidota bacterium]
MHYRIWFIIGCFLFSVNVIGQSREDSLKVAEILDGINEEDRASLGELSLHNPRGAVSRHLYFLQADSYQPTLAAQALFKDDRSAEERIELAIKLKQIYDGLSHYVEPEEIPDSPNYRDSLAGSQIYRILPKQYPDIYLKKYGDNWRYSRKTIGTINKIHRRVFPLGADFLVNLVPKVGNYTFLGLKVWQYLGIVLLLVVSFISYRLLDWLFGLIIRRLIPRFFPNAQLTRELVPPVARPLSFLLVIELISWLIPALQFQPDGLGRYVNFILQVATPSFAVIVVYRLVDILAAVFKSLAGRTETTMDDQLVPLLTKAAKLIVVVLGIIFILDNLDVNVTALLAGVSIGGLALALAAQDTVKNFIGSISIFVDRPFVIGDFIEFGGISGTVAEVGVRSTRVRASDGALVSIPNGDLANKTITNHKMRTYRRYSTTIG